MKDKKIYDKRAVKIERYVLQTTGKGADVCQQSSCHRPFAPFSLHSPLPRLLNLSDSASSRMTHQAWGRQQRTCNMPFHSLKWRRRLSMLVSSSRPHCRKRPHHYHHLMNHLVTRIYVAFAKQTRSSVLILLNVKIVWSSLFALYAI